MSGPLQQTLQSARPRERSGSSTVGRYDYQAHCGLLKLVELHKAEGDFRIVFDYFDDMLILNSSATPDGAQMLQIKTKDAGDWSTANLCALVGSQAPRSIVARLYDHLVVLGDPVTQTSFVSNAAFKVMLKDGSKSSGDQHWINGDEIHDEDIETIRKAVEKDTSPCDMAKWRSRLVLIRSPMSVHGQKAYVIGVLHEFFCNELELPDVALDAIYETLYETIQECTRFSQDGIPADEIIRKKSITRADIDAVIERASHRRASFLADWPTVVTELAKAGVGSARQIRLRNAATEHMANRSAGHAVANDIADAAAAWVSKNSKAVAAAESIFELASAMAVNVGSKQAEGDHLLGAMLAEAYEAINEK